MKAGTLRHRVTLQSRVDTVDAIGQPSTSWSTTATVWADVRYLTGISAIKAGSDSSVGKVSVRLRYQAVNAGQRIVYGTQVFDVQAVLPDAKKTYVDCVCEAINVEV